MLETRPSDPMALPQAAASAVVPVVLCGGGGERLWPVSRASVPKHVLRLAGQPSLLERTLRRLKAAPSLAAAPLVLCNEGDRFLVREEVDRVCGGDARIVVEPARRDSAAAVALAVAAVAEEAPDAVMLVVPADHLIVDVAAFDRSVAEAAALARDGRIVTFGIAPDSPNVNYGYIKSGAPLAGSAGLAVERFVEKPDRATAAAMLAEGGYFWNAGIFVFQAAAMQAALERHYPEGWSAAGAAWRGRRLDLGMIRLDAEAFAAAPRISIDYAVMEKVGDLMAVVPAGFDWSDVGTWPAVAAMLRGDERGNAVWGRSVLVDSADTLVYADGDVLVAAAGLDGMLVAVTPDAVMVCPKDKAADLKALVRRVRDLGHPEADQHRAGYRPWGHFDPLARGERYQVKKLLVRPGGVLSLQKHHHRSEHWVVVRGTARVTIGEEVRVISENESIYIPLNTLHRLENPGRIDLEIIEVQTGAYLGEDDIVRVADAYGRSG